MLPCFQSTKKTIISTVQCAQDWGAEQIDWYIRSFKSGTAIAAAVRLAEKTCAFAEAFASLAHDNGAASSSVSAFCGRAKVLGGTASTLLAIPSNTRDIYRAWSKVVTPKSSIYHLSAEQRILLLAKVTLSSVYLVCAGVNIAMKLFNYTTGTARLGVALPYLKMAKTSSSVIYTTSGLSSKKAENLWRMELHEKYDKDPNLTEEEKMILAEADLLKEKAKANYAQLIRERQIDGGLTMFKDGFDFSSSILLIRLEGLVPWQQISASLGLISAVIGTAQPLYREHVLMRHEKELEEEAKSDAGKKKSKEKVEAAKKALSETEAEAKEVIQKRLKSRGITLDSLDTKEE